MDNHVGMAQFLVTEAPVVIRSTGLGSCIGIALYDPFARVGGLAHAMLPKHRPGRDDNKAKYVDTAIDAMLLEMEVRGASRVNIVAKLAGGSHMFPELESSMVIGAKNVAAAQGYLGSLGIPILAQDVGGNCGRTVEFDCQDGSLSISTINKLTKI